MTFAINGPAWVELPYGQEVTIGDAVSSYETVMLWSPQMRTSRGIKVIVDDEIPPGKIATGSSIVDDAGKPRRVWTLEDAPPPPVPSSASAAQCKMALYDAGLLDDVEALIAGYPYRPVRIWYDNANTWERDHAYIHALSAELSLSDAQVDDLFRAAALLG